MDRLSGKSVSYVQADPTSYEQIWWNSKNPYWPDKVKEGYRILSSKNQLLIKLNSLETKFIQLRPFILTLKSRQL